MSPLENEQKPTIWILDDQWRSALTKISWFFTFTEAAFPVANSPGVLNALEASVEAAGWRLKSIQPSDLNRTRLRNGIVLIDVNWSAAPSSETGLAGIHPSEKENFGITLAEDILARRSEQDNLELILFSHTKGSRLTDYFVDLMQRGIERVYPVVILDESSDGPLIRKYGWEACRRVTTQILQQIPGSVRKILSDQIEARLAAEDFVSIDDFTGGQNELRADQISIKDLAVPFYQRVEASEADASNENASQAGREPLREWQELIQGRRICFELSTPPENQPTALLCELLRYKSVDHLDGFLFLKEIRSSRYIDPVAELKKTLTRSKGHPRHAVLHAGFKRIVSVGLGTPIRKLADGVELKDVEATPFQNLPPTLHDRALFDVQGSTHTPEAKIGIFDQGETGFRIKIAEDIIWENRLIEAAAELKQIQENEQLPVEKLFTVLQRDPENRDTILEIAKRREALLKHAPPDAPQWQTVQESAEEWRCRLSQAFEGLKSYRDEVIQRFEDFDEKGQKAFRKDLTGCDQKLQLWEEWHQNIETLCQASGSTESIGEHLACLLKHSDTSEGSDALQKALSDYFPRARGYARRILENKLKRSGGFQTEHLRLIDRGFARLFPIDDPDACSQTWLTIALVALGPRENELPTLSKRQLEKQIVKTLAHELVSQIASLEGYLFLEGGESLDALDAYDKT